MGDNFDRIAWNQKVVMLTNFVVVNLLLISAFGNSFGLAAQPKGSAQKSGQSRQLTITHLNATSVTVNWTSFSGRDSPSSTSSSSQCPVQMYIIRMKQSASKQTQSWKVDGARESLTLHDIRPDTEHYVRLLAILCDGKRRKSTRWYKVPHYERPDASVRQVPGPPTSLSVWTSSNMIFVNWLPPTGNARVRGYTIGYGEGVPDIDFRFVDSSYRNVTIVGLKYLAQYVVSVRAFNEAGRSEVVYDIVYTGDKQTQIDSLNSVSSSSLASTLPAPTNFRVKLASRTASLQWTDPSLDLLQKITDERFYSVYFHGVPTGKNLSVIVKALQVTLYDLEPNRWYKFKVRTVKGAVVSPFSDEILQKTPSDDSSLNSGQEDARSPRVTTGSSNSFAEEVEDYDYYHPSANRKIDEAVDEDAGRGGRPQQQQPGPTAAADVKTKRHNTIHVESQARRLASFNPDPANNASSVKVVFRSMVQVKVSAYITWPETLPTGVQPSCAQSPSLTNDQRPAGRIAGYIFRYRLADETDYVVTNLANNFVLLENLAQNSKYFYQVRYVVDRGTASGWSQDTVLETGGATP